MSTPSISMPSLLLLPLFLISSLVLSASANIVYDNNIADSYDFIICGGGLAGLVLAARLSEDSNHTVLVLEAGATGDDVAEKINTPDDAYFSSLLGSSYDWAYETVNQPAAGNRPMLWPRGKVLGGSSAVNGMYLVRPSANEVNAWSTLLGDDPHASSWNWDSLYAAMKKSETFTAPTDAIANEANIEYNLDSHGSSGPIHSSYPGYMYPIVGNWTQTLSTIGIPATTDADSGDGSGAYIATSAINPSNWTRSYSRSAYIDPLPPRSNLDILPNATVTRIIFSGTNTTTGLLNATKVEWTYSYQGTTGKRNTVGVNKEVILAGGAMGSPHILMHSGVGPADVLANAGVTPKLVLPGVGQHLQDHISTEVVFSTSSETAATNHQANGAAVTSGVMGSFINSATAYANATNLFLGNVQQFHDVNVNATYSTSMVPSTDPTVIAGYRAIYQATADTMLLSNAGQVELLLSITGSPNGPDTVAIQAALQHPYSQGYLYINSSDPFVPPVIDPQYLSHPADAVMLRQGLKLARTIGTTYPLSSTLTGELTPGAAVQTDDQWDAWLAGAIGTEYHPSCTCAMLPLELGGVVDGSLTVHGLSNVRVVDSSVFPIQFAAHLMAPTYGLAEQAADIIRNQWNVVAPAQSVSSTMVQSQTQTFSTYPTTTKASHSGAASSSTRIPALVSLFSGALLLGLLERFA